MAGQRLARAGGDQLAVPGGDRGGERVHESRVAAAVALGGVHPALRLGGDRPLGAGEEVVDADGLAVAVQLGAGAEQLGAAMPGLAERGHREGGRGRAGKLQRDDLMVDGVVVAGVDAPAVRAVVQRRVQGFGREVVDDDAQRPAVRAPVEQAAVEPRRRVGAARFDGAGDAPVRGARRAVRGGEVGQAAEARDPQRRPAQDVLQPVQVVAGLGHQHGGRQVAAPPVAADIGVGLVPEPDRLQVLDAHDVTELAGAGDLLDRARVRRVAHHVADGEHDPGLLHRGHDPPAPRLVRCHRLFQQDVVAERGERLGRLGVHPVLGADQDRVGEPAAAGQLSPVGGRVPGCDAVLGGETGAA